MSYSPFLHGGSPTRARIGTCLLNTLASTLVFAISVGVGAQQPRAATLASLTQLADTVSPAIKSAEASALAAREKVRSAGSRPDPMLMLGLINVPLSPLSLTSDEMTMKMIGIEQNFPYPGKLGLSTRIAALQADAADAAVDSVRNAVRRDVKMAFYEIAYIEAALSVLDRSNRVLQDVALIANARYSAGTGLQQEVLRATLEATRVNESANSLREQRLAVLSRLTSAIGRQVEDSIESPSIPKTLAAAAVSLNADIRFASSTLGASASGSPLPSLKELQETAVASNPMLRARAAMVAAGNAEVALARKAYLPDVDVSLQYGQRSAFRRSGAGERMSRSDMISATISVPIPLQRGRKQNADVATSRYDVVALAAMQRDAENMVRAEVAGLYSDITHSRTQLALYVKAIMPQADAALTAAKSSYQAGTGDLVAVLSAQTTMLELESGYHRALTDFAQKLAELDAVVGREVLP